MDMVDLAKQNDCVKFVLNATDIFSRFARRIFTSSTPGQRISLLFLQPFTYTVSTDFESAMRFNNLV